MARADKPLDVALLDEAVAFAKRSAHGDDVKINGLPVHWDQSIFASLPEGAQEQAEVNLETCGTAYCIAGYVVARQPGYHAEVRRSSGGGWGAAAPYFLYEELNGRAVRNHDGIAIDALGLTPNWAWELFDGENELDDIIQTAERIKANAAANDGYVVDEEEDED